MKKHPVDDLFQKRLASWEKEPSELAWKRIQEGQKRRSRRMVAWVWYAAASVVLTFITGYVVWHSQNDIFSPVPGSSEIARVEQIIPKEELSIDSISVKNKSLSEEEWQTTSPVEQPSLAKRKIPSEATLTKPNWGRRVEMGKINGSAPVQIAKIEATKTEELKVEKTEILQSVAPEKTIPKTVELAQREEKKPDRTIIVEVEEPVNEVKDKSKSRLSRVFRQLKNVREAEPVDWDDVGFNPKSIIARADDRTNDDEKISGKRERKN